MLRKKEDLARDRNLGIQQLDFTKKVDKEKNIEKSRRLVIVMLLATAGLSLFLWFARSLSFYFKTNPSVSFSNIFSSRKSLDFSSSKPNIDSIIEKILASETGEWAAYVHVLDKSDLSWSKNADLTLTAASLIKLPVILTYYQEVEAGNIDPSAIYRLERQDLRLGAGSLQYQKIGSASTYQDLAHLSLNESDNTAYTALLRILTPSKVNEFIEFLGLTSTNLEENTTSASDMGKIFKHIYDSPALSALSRKQIIDSLTNTAFENRFPAGLPQGIHITHKVGTETNSVSDAGIVFTPDKNFILVLIADKISPPKAELIFSKFSRSIYWQLLNY